MNKTLYSRDFTLNIKYTRRYRIINISRKIAGVACVGLVLETFILVDWER